MAAGIFDIIIEQGATFTMNATWKDSAGSPVNLTGYSARMQIRERFESDTAIVSLTSGSGITLGGALGTIAVSIAASVTQTFVVGDCVYDLELVSSGGIVTRLLQGKATISPEVTR